MIASKGRFKIEIKYEQNSFHGANNSQATKA